MEQEALEILNMVKEGKITPEQGSELLEALKAPSATISRPGKPRFVRVRVNITPGPDGGGKETVAVNLNLPIALADMALKLAEGAKIQQGEQSIVLGDYIKKLSGMDMATILELVKEGAEGKLVDVNVVNDNQHVKCEVTVD